METVEIIGICAVSVVVAAVLIWLFFYPHYRFLDLPDVEEGGSESIAPEKSGGCDHDIIRGQFIDKGGNTRTYRACRKCPRYLEAITSKNDERI